MHPSKSISMVSENCAACKKPVAKKECLCCAICKSTYDILCLNMSSQRYNSFYGPSSDRKQSWKCPECLSKVRKQGNLNTPVRASPSESITNDSVNNSASPDNGNENVTLRNKLAKTSAGGDSTDEIEASSSTSFTVLAEELRAMRQELRRMCDHMASFTEAINTRMDRLEQRMDSVENKNIGIADSRIRELEDKVLKLKTEIQDRDQEALGNDVEIASFPESRSENATHVILTVAKKLGMELNEHDVVSAQRVGPAPTPVEGGVPPRPRPLVVRLARRATREALLRAARVRRGVTTEGMALQEHGSPRSFYINERLTKANRQLFQKAREAAKRNDWKYVWTREGKIYARKEQGKASVRLRYDVDIVRVFGSCGVSSEPSVQ